jgi:hypothetical protein
LLLFFGPSNKKVISILQIFSLILNMIVKALDLLVTEVLAKGAKKKECRISNYIELYTLRQVVGGVSKNGGGEPKNRWEGGVALAAV